MYIQMEKCIYRWRNVYTGGEAAAKSTHLMPHCSGAYKLLAKRQQVA